MAVDERPPICTLCGNEMVRLKRLGEKKDTVMYACGTGEPHRSPCDGGSARLGSQFA